MAIQTRTIKRRIKSVKNTRKITKAMELVAASKMRKAVSLVLASRPYSKLAWQTVLSLSKKVDTTAHPLLKKNKAISNLLLLVVSSDRGLAGGFNTNVIKLAVSEIKKQNNDVQVQVIAIGKRGADALRRLDKHILANFTDITNNTKFETTLPIGRMILDEFISGKFDAVKVVYTDYVSAISQHPLVLDLLPLADREETAQLGDVYGTEKDAPVKSDLVEYIFEPSPKEVLEKILPRLIETMIYQTVLESAASEHSARMMAMRSASDNAEEMIDDLTFTFNQARQAGITQEIAEISSGKAALEK